MTPKEYAAAKHGLTSKAASREAGQADAAQSGSRSSSIYILTESGEIVERRIRTQRERFRNREIDG
jgi:hypothetical protein